MFYLAYLALGLAVFFMVQTVFSDEERRSAGRALGLPDTALARAPRRQQLLALLRDGPRSATHI